MHENDIDEVCGWITERALAGASETELLRGFCDRVNAAGLPLSSAVAVIDTLHPIWEGRAFLWRNDGVEEEPAMEYGSTREGEAAERWKSTAFHHLLESGADEVRRRIGFGEPADFLRLDELKEQGHTDYIALMQRFPSETVIGEMDGIYSHWTTRSPDGFGEADCAALRRVVPRLALGLKVCITLSHRRNPRGSLPREGRGLARAQGPDFPRDGGTHPRRALVFRSSRLHLSRRLD